MNDTLHCKSVSQNLKRIHMLETMFSYHARIIFVKDHRKIPKYFKQNNTLLNNSWVKEETK